MNIVLDTNSLIMSIAPKSPYRKVWNAFLKGDYNLCVSNEIIEEYWLTSKTLCLAEYH